MNKKGGLETEELVKLVIGVVIIVLVLLPLSVKLIGVLRPNTVPSLQAESLLEEIMESSEILEDDGEWEILAEGPKDWALLSTDTQICMCPAKYPGPITKSWIEFSDECVAEGICEDLNVEISNFCPVQFEERTSCLHLDGLMELKLKKIGNKITINATRSEVEIKRLDEIETSAQLGASTGP